MVREHWASIPGYEKSYQISTTGRIKQISSGPGIQHGKILKPDVCANNYLAIRLYKDGKQKRLLIHRLVLLTFVGECQQGHECRHLDGNRQNNNLNNLRWGTHAENVNDCHSHGRYKSFPGSKNPMSILTEQQVIIIKQIASAGRNGHPGKKISYQQIGDTFGVGRSQISNIVNSRRWRHVNG